MGRNRRRGGVGQRLSNEAIIRITGAPSIVPTSFTGVARMNQSWYSFLAENGLQLTPAHGIYVRTSSSFNVSGGRRIPGFGAQLNEKVGTFLDKFKYKNRKQFTLRLMTKKPVIKYQPPSKPLRNVASSIRQGQRSAGIPSGGSGVGVAGSRRSAVQGNQVKASQQFVRGFHYEEVEEGDTRTAGRMELRAIKVEMVDEGEVATINMADNGGQGEEVVAQLKREEEVDVPQEVEEEEVRVQQQEEEDDDFDDAMSVMTSASQEDMDLRRKGIRMEDLKNPASRRFDMLKNSFLLRVRHEIKRLKERKVWTRNYQRSPLACYLLEEVLKP